MENQNERDLGISSDFRKRDTSPIYASESQTTKRNSEQDLVSQINRESLSELHNQVSHLQEELDKEKNVSNRLKAELTDVSKSLSKKESYQKGLQTQTRNALLKVEALTEEIENLKSLNPSQSSNGDKETILSLEKELEAANVELDQLRKQSATLQSELTSLQKKHDSLILQAEQALAFKDIHDGVQKALDSANNEINKLQVIIENERKSTESNKLRLESEIESLTKQLSDYANNNTLDEKLVVGLKADLSKLGQELSQVKQENDNLKQTASTLDTDSEEVVILQQSLENLDKEYKALMDDLGNKVPKQDLDSANLKNSSLTEELENVQKELNDSNLTIEGLKQEVAGIKEQHSNCVDKSQLDDLRNSFSKLERDLASALSENEKLLVTLAQLRQQLEGKESDNMETARITELEKQLAVAEVDKASLSELCDKLEERAIKAETKANAFKDLEALYNGVLKDLVKVNPKASDDFDALLMKYIGGREYLIDLLD